MRLYSFEDEADRCRDLAREFGNLTESPLLMSLAEAFQRLELETAATPRQPQKTGIRLFA
jgi:hypothetical protein